MGSDAGRREPPRDGQVQVAGGDVHGLRRSGSVGPLDLEPDHPSAVPPSTAPDLDDLMLSPIRPVSVRLQIETTYPDHERINPRCYRYPVLRFPFMSAGAGWLDEISRERFDWARVGPHRIESELRPGLPCRIVGGRGRRSSCPVRVYRCERDTPLLADRLVGSGFAPAAVQIGGP